MPSSARLYHFPNSMLVVQNQWSQKDYGLDSGDVVQFSENGILCDFLILAVFLFFNV
jgi:hypothetical protein